jgi:hypothetical protein
MGKEEQKLIRQKKVWIWRMAKESVLEMVEQHMSSLGGQGKHGRRW